MALINQGCDRVYISPKAEIIRLDRSLSILSQSSYYTLSDEDIEWVVEELEDYGEL